MRPALGAIGILGLGAAFGLGRLTAPEARSEASIEDFRAGLTDRDTLQRAYRLSGFLRKLGPEDLPDTLQAVEEKYLSVRPYDVTLLMSAWSRFDAPAAFAWARAWPTSWRDSLMREALLAWGFRDPSAAFAALEELDDPDLAKSLRPSVLEGWLGSSDHQGVGAYIADIGDPRVRRRLSFSLATEVAKDGPDAVIAWAESVPVDAPNDFKQGSFYHASSVLGRDDPQRAAAWFEAHRADAYSEGSLDVIARKWAQHHDPAALFVWLRGLPAGEGERQGEVGRAVAAGFRAWRQRDSTAAETWLRSALPDPKLDPAIEDLAWHQAQGSPASAAAWALLIENEKMRNRNLTRILRAWLEKDPGEASAWLAGSGLPESLRKSIADGAQPRRRRRAAGATPGAR